MLGVGQTEEGRSDSLARPSRVDIGLIHPVPIEDKQVNDRAVGLSDPDIPFRPNDIPETRLALPLLCLRAAGSHARMPSATDSTASESRDSQLGALAAAPHLDMVPSAQRLTEASGPGFWLGIMETAPSLQPLLGSAPQPDVNLSPRVPAAAQRDWRRSQMFGPSLVSARARQFSGQSPGKSRFASFWVRRRRVRPSPDCSQPGRCPGGVIPVRRRCAIIRRRERLPC